MAELSVEYGSYALENIELFPAPNPAITEFLLGDRLQGVVAEYTAKVGASYVQRLGNRPHKGDKHPGAIESTVDLSVFLGGYRTDRWVGEVTAGSAEFPYALADEEGRYAYNAYPGHHDLRDSLHNVLEQGI